MSKKLVAYFSASGVTAKVAETLAEATFAVTPDAEKYATSFLLIVFFLINLFISFIQHEV